MFRSSTNTTALLPTGGPYTPLRLLSKRPSTCQKGLMVNILYTDSKLTSLACREVATHECCAWIHGLFLERLTQQAVKAFGQVFSCCMLKEAGGTQTCSCAMFAVVRALKVINIGAQLSLGKPCTRCLLMYVDLPVPARSGITWHRHIERGECEE